MFDPLRIDPNVREHLDRLTAERNWLRAELADAIRDRQRFEAESNKLRSELADLASQQLFP